MARKSPSRRPNLKDFAEMCRLKSGNKTNIAAGFNVSRMTVHKWMKDERYETAYQDFRESLLDFNESQQLLLIRGIPKYEEDKEGNKKMVGWIERPSETMSIWWDKKFGKYNEKLDIDANLNIKGFGDFLKEVAINDNENKENLK